MGIWACQASESCFYWHGVENGDTSPLMASGYRRSYAQALTFLVFASCQQEAPKEGLHPLTPVVTRQGAMTPLPTDVAEKAIVPEVPTPIATLRATRAYTVFASASKDSQLRGRILRGSDFHIFDRRKDQECNDGWVQVSGGWICSHRAEVSKKEPIAFPRLPKGSDVPFVYARHRKHKDSDTAPLEVFRSIRKLNAGAKPVGTLSAYGSHAFVRRTRNRGDAAFITASGRAVPAKDMARFRPSRFQGRDLKSGPIPAGKALSWTPYDDTPVFTEASLESKEVSKLSRHSELIVTPIPGNEDWVKLDSEDGPSGFVSTSDLRLFTPTPPDSSNDELAIDVELNDQILSIWIGVTPIFATLISSGKPSDRTPLGLYTIETKWAFSKMENRDGDDPYFVAAVPWTMYFSGRYALHASYWHNRFGQRLSHGCINLSPRDAKRVFELTSPSLPPGWLLVHALDDEPGTSLRIRRGNRPVPDRRFDKVETSDL